MSKIEVISKAMIDVNNNHETVTKRKPVFNSILAGYVAGSCGVFIGHPLDSLKILAQTKSGHVGGSTLFGSTDNGSSKGNSVVTKTSSTSCANNHSRSIMTVAADATRFMNTSNAMPRGRRSIMSLYAGIGPPLLTSGLIQSINFALYDSSRRVLYQYKNENKHRPVSKNEYLYNDSIQNVAISASFSGLCLSLITSPILVIKTTQQIMLWDFQKALGEIMKSATNKCKNNGISTINSFKKFYVAYPIHAVGSSIGRGIYMATYESSKRFLVERRAKRYERNVGGGTNGITSCTILERMICAAIAGMTSWSVCYPLDSVQNRLYKQSVMVNQENVEKRKKPLSAWEMAQHMYNKRQSIRSFYRGYQVTILRAGPVAAVVLPIYDLTLEWLNKIE